jgi:Tol biopolymer transport system component
VLLARQVYTDSLDVPMFWPDGSRIVYQRSNLQTQVGMSGQAQPQYQSKVEQIGLDGSGPSLLLDDARYPAPAPDGSRLAFVRSSDRGPGIFVQSLADGSTQELVKPGQFLALAYPRFSPDGRQLAFSAITPLNPIGTTSPLAHLPGLADALTVRAAAAHGFPWDVWLVNADGSNLRQLADIVDDDPSVAWSPDGTQLLVYGGWGSYLVDVARGTSVAVPHLAGYGSVAWLPD